MSSRRILVIEDNPDNMTLIVDVLLSLDYQVIQAADGEKGVDLARSEQPDLILMDLSLPRMDGWKALKELKADAELRDIPVIMVTVLNERGMAIPLGAADFMTKPVDRQRLAAMLREHCRGPSNASILVRRPTSPAQT